MLASQPAGRNPVATHVLLVSPVEIPATIVDEWREAGRSLADFLDGPVTLWQVDGAGATDPALSAFLRTLPPDRQEVLAPRGSGGKGAPMAAAPFVWRADGRPDWRAMWSSFCELALFGGPPHRGPDNPLHAVKPTDDGAGTTDAVAEIRRGIWETTGLFAEPAEPGWLAVTCSSPKMAAWLCATIILENVDARVEEERLLVPADPSFTLEDQVKSVITVVAKTHHYWTAHTVGE
jgi:hypothetical protein